MTKTFMDQLNETPVTYCVMLVYVTIAYLTGGFGMEPEHEPMITYGAAVGMLIQDGEPWRILSHAFVHGGLIHLALNSYALLILGPPLERYMRTLRFVTLYVVSAITGCLVALFVNVEHVPLVGGSGALFGMLGAALAFNIRGGRTMLDFLENQGARQLIGIIAVNLLIGYFIPVVSNAAHVGGLIGGFVLVFCFFDVGRREKVDSTGRLIQFAWIALLLSCLLYATHPVLRFDYNLKQYLRETDPTRRQQIFAYLDGYDDFSGRGYPESEIRRALVQSEPEPRTGLAGVSWRERTETSVPWVFQRIRKWKKGE